MFHSSKGGVGKSLLSLNYAAYKASQGWESWLIELDFSMGSIINSFPSFKPPRSISEWLINGNKPIEECLLDISESYPLIKAPLRLGLIADESQKLPEIRKRTFSMDFVKKALGRLVALQERVYELSQQSGKNIAITFDTTPGMSPIALQASLVADRVVLMVRPTNAHYKKTADLVQNFHKEKFEQNRAIGLIVNQISGSLVGIEEDVEKKKSAADLIRIGDEAPVEKSPSHWSVVWKRFQKNKLATYGFFVILVVAIIAVLAPVMSPDYPTSLDPLFDKYGGVCIDKP